MALQTHPPVDVPTPLLEAIRTFPTHREIEHCGQKLLFAREIVVDRGVIDPSRRSDVTHAQALQSFLGDLVEGRFDKLLPPIGNEGGPSARPPRQWRSLRHGQTEPSGRWVTNATRPVAIALTNPYNDARSVPPKYLNSPAPSLSLLDNALFINHMVCKYPSRQNRKGDIAYGGHFAQSRNQIVVSG